MRHGRIHSELGIQFPMCTEFPTFPLAAGGALHGRGLISYPVTVQ
jgi:hypothetical protein